MRVRRAAAQVASFAGDAPLALVKQRSNLYRHRGAGARHRVDLGALCHVLGHDEDQRCVEVEGLVSYETLVDWCLRRGVMPAVVPQLRTITVGGAVAGVGIEATSFRHGPVHHTMTEVDVLLPGGDVVTCTAGNEHADLFYGFPNSYGTLGYATRLRMNVVAAGAAVHVRHERFTCAQAFLQALATACAGDADFVDGVAFARDLLVLNTGRFADGSPWLSSYAYDSTYCDSLLDRDEDYLESADYLWRWDAHWAWAARNIGPRYALVRRLLGPRRLATATGGREIVVQDVHVPLARAAELLQFLLEQADIRPVWVCPVRGEDGGLFPLYPMDAAPVYVNFGIWDGAQSPATQAGSSLARSLEEKVLALGGLKVLYSDSHFSPAEFAGTYGMEAYWQLKRRYDPGQRALDLYGKCVRAL